MLLNKLPGVAASEAAPTSAAFSSQVFSFFSTGCSASSKLRFAEGDGLLRSVLSFSLDFWIKKRKKSIEICFPKLKITTILKSNTNKVNYTEYDRAVIAIPKLKYGFFKKIFN